MLIMFTGTECDHCHEMNPVVEKLEKEEGIKIEKLEIWHNEENMKKFVELEDGKCGGIPFFYNDENKKWICGNCDYEKLKAWAKEA